MKTGILWLFIIIALIGAGLYFMYVPTSAPHGALENHVTFYCGSGNTIAATFRSSSVNLLLSDGQAYTMPQTVSGSGIRYEASTTDNGAVVFTSKGAYASLTDTASTTDVRFQTCTAARVAPAAPGFETYADQPQTFTFTFPTAFSVSGVPVGYGLSWTENATSTGMELARVDVPQSYEPGTNFGGAWFTVGVSSMPSALATCFRDTTGMGTGSTTQVTINGTPYTTWRSVGAGAGNRYDTTTFRTVHANECYAVEYTIHYGVLQNYPPGAVHAFDQQKVQNALESIVQSFRFTS